VDLVDNYRIGVVSKGRRKGERVNRLDRDEDEGFVEFGNG